MALKAVNVSDVPIFDHQITDNPSLVISGTGVPSRVSLPETGNGSLNKKNNFPVIGHRGKGMNLLTSVDSRFKNVKENSILSFNEASRFPIDFVEFDVQVTKDGYPIVFHDDFIITEEGVSFHESGTMSERRVTDLDVEEFLSYGPQKNSKKTSGKALHRRTNGGGVVRWSVEDDDSLCTLEEVFNHVDPLLGFNIELKFDDHVAYMAEHLTHSLQLILNVVHRHSKDRRPIIFSSFHPDAAVLMRKLQSIHPVYFLTDEGNEEYRDARRNSLDEAIKHCSENGLDGIVSEVRGVFRNPELIPRIKESNLSLLTYGQLNNVPEAVYMQRLIGVDGVIVDLVKEITDAVSDFVDPVEDSPEFSQRELTFLLKLIPQLVQH